MGEEAVKRCGFDEREVKNLYSRYRKQNLQQGFGSFDNFLKFCQEVGYVPSSLMRRFDEDKPHSRENTFFVVRDQELLDSFDKRGPKEIDVVSSFCEGCKRECPSETDGCANWRHWFVKNWNENIYRTEVAQPEPKKEPKPEPQEQKKKFFRYEHPDLVRELGERV